MGRFESFFNEIASQLDLTKTEEETIINSYEAVGSFLNESKYLTHYSPRIFPQGSMRIGTTVKPLKKDDYDIDLVCELTKNYYDLSPREVKHLVGTSLKFGKYLSQLENEHGRCWTLKYSANPPYHLDILPAATSKGERVNATRKDNDGNYSWLPTNPKGFANWFLSLYKRKFILDEEREVEKVNVYGTRNPLQRTVQLIKRHRDVYFRNRKEDGPASIIITTLTGLSYSNETTIEDILRNGPLAWVNYIKRENGKYIIKVPSLPDDNYADKWNGEDKNAANLFFEWHAKLISDLDKLFRQSNFESFIKVAKEMFLTSVVDKVINENTALCDSLANSFKKKYPVVLVDAHPLFRHALSINSDNHKYIPRENAKIRIRGTVYKTIEDRKNNNNCLYEFDDYSPLLEKDLRLKFKADIFHGPNRCYLRWQVTNTGEEALNSGENGLRGKFEYSEAKVAWTKYECTSYTGTHFVQAFLIDSDTGNCVAMSNILTINIGG